MTNLFEIDPAYIATQCRYIRRVHKLTQENLSEMASLSVRSIEKIESGRHRCQMQSLELIAKAVGVKVGVFRKPSAEEEAKIEAEMKLALKKTIIIRTQPMRTANNFLGIFGDWDARRFDASQIEDDEALEIAAGLNDHIDDIGYIWEDCREIDRLQYARTVSEMCAELRDRGYLCHIGSHLQRRLSENGPDLIFKVGVLTFLPLKDNDEERYAIIQLQPGWITTDS